MRLIIAGSRKLKCDDPISLITECLGYVQWTPTWIVSGKCYGPDTWGELWAENHGIPVKEFPADWTKYGPYQAGHIRNEEMALFADAALVLWNGVSGGSKNMIQHMRRYEKPCEVFTPTRINNSRNLQDVLNDKT